MKGYTGGLAVELNEKDWALRGGWFLEPTIAVSATSTYAFGSISAQSSSWRRGIYGWASPEHCATWCSPTALI